MTTYRGYKLDGTKRDFDNLPCGYCGFNNTPEGHDWCLRTLIGTMNACCGHGDKNQAYIQFLDGECVRKQDALDIIKILKKKQ